MDFRSFIFVLFLRNSAKGCYLKTVSRRDTILHRFNRPQQSTRSSLSYRRFRAGPGMAAVRPVGRSGWSRRITARTDLFSERLLTATDHNSARAPTPAAHRRPGPASGTRGLCTPTCQCDSATTDTAHFLRKDSDSCQIPGHRNFRRPGPLHGTGSASDCLGASG
jgi:hypothetical protein